MQPVPVAVEIAKDDTSALMLLLKESREETRELQSTRLELSIELAQAKGKLEAKEEELGRLLLEREKLLETLRSLSSQTST